MNNKASYVLIVMFLFLASSALGASNKDVAVASVGKTIVGATSGKANIKVEIVTREVNITESDRDNEALPATACTYSRFPCSLVDNIKISVGAKSIFVQHSVFLDVADINTARIETTKNAYVLHLEGGDASESYVAIIAFDKNRVKYKKIYAGEGGGLLRETVYHVVTLE